MNTVVSIKKRGAGMALLLTLAIVGAAESASMAQSSAIRLKIDTGQLQSVARDEVISFKGIPFAAPPVGALRWRPPQTAHAWSGVRRAENFGPDCMQVPFPSDAAPLGVQPQEDCLYVNVWLPATRPATEHSWQYLCAKSRRNIPATRQLHKCYRR